MALRIDDLAGVMVSEECDAKAVRDGDGRWTVTGRDGTYSRNQAITAMTIAEALARGCDADDLLVQTLEAELDDDRG